MRASLRPRPNNPDFGSATMTISASSSSTPSSSSAASTASATLLPVVSIHSIA